MIPKIAHFHWDGPPMNWLRMMSLFTFIRLNPRWKVVLHRTPEHIRKRKLPSLGNEADWTWLEAVHDHGGFAMATDTVFIRPVPDEWLNADLCACTNEGDLFFHCCFGSVAGLSFLSDCIDACWKMNPPALGYQDMGITLLNDTVLSYGGIGKMADEGLDLYKMAVQAMTPVLSGEPDACWSKDELPLTEQTVGVTWFGGAPCSAREWHITSSSDYELVRLANEVVQNAGVIG